MPPMAGPTYDDTNGTVTVTLSAGSDPNKAITAENTVIGTMNFTAKATTDPATGTTVDFVRSPLPEILSIGSNDLFNENVLVNAIPAIIYITDANVTATPTTEPDVSPTDVPEASPTTEPDVSPTTVPQTTGLTCSSLTVDPAASGTTPYSVNLTANGQSSDSTISKVTFNFGDGQTQDITDSAGIGTDSISVLQSHVYQSAGNYTATAVLTDADGNVSSTTNCSVAISVSNVAVTPVPTEAPTETPIITETPLQNEQTGPSGLVTVGSIGAIITVIGAVLLLAL